MQASDAPERSELKRALVVAAHPDDIEFSCSGTVATMVDDGWDVAYVLVTCGQRGSQDPRAAPGELAAIRRKETREAARICGVEDVTFLTYADSELLAADPIALRKDLSREFRRHRPHRLFALEPAILPSEFFVNHPDHRLTGEATLDITVTGGTTGAIFPELELEEGLPPWRGLEAIWIMGPAGGATAVDVTAVMDRKIASLRAHPSQLGEWDVEPRVRAWLQATGEAHGLAYAETFRVIDLRR